MSGTLRATEAPATGLRRVLDRCIGRARRCVGTRSGLSDENLHDARRAIKRARGTLRLLRAALDRESFRAMNRGLRDAGRPLRDVRDARVLIDTLKALAEPLDGRAAPLALTLKRGLETEYRKQRRALTAHSSALADVRRELARIQHAAGKWVAACDEWPLLSRSLHRIYRDARRAGTLARESPSDENLHEWRKQVKHLDQALGLLQDIRPGRLGVRADEAQRIAVCLGDDHDLAVLKGRLAMHSTRGVGCAALEAALEARRAELQDRAMTLAEALFGDRPTQFVASIEPDFKAWRHESK